MDFGRLPNVDNINFALPKDDKGTERLWSKLKKSDLTPQVYVGCPVWGQKEWVGKIYPANTKEKDFLKHYTRQFNSIELNATHYRIPGEATIRNWKAAAEKGFKFCPKIPQEISHQKQLQNCYDLTTVFCNMISGLEDHLGLTFLQLSPAFSPQKISVLENYLNQFPKDIPLAVELRHEGWFNNREIFNRVFDLLESKNISSVITDVAGRRDVLHQRLTTSTAFVRFTANDLHVSDFERMNHWVDRIKSWLDKGIQTVYFFVHTPTKSLNPELVNYMIDRLNVLCNLSLSRCKIAIAEGQQNLFQ